MKWKFCPECGTKLDGKWKFCPECGCELDAGDAAPIDELVKKFKELEDKWPKPTQPIIWPSVPYYERPYPPYPKGPDIIWLGDRGK